jgi:hypothetical protein
MNQQHSSKHSNGGGNHLFRFAIGFAVRRVNPIAIVFLTLAIGLLGGCAPARQAESLPTLIPTLALVIAPTETPTLSPTPAPDTATPTLTDTPTPEPTATITITPWVPDTATPGPSPTITRTLTPTRTATRTRVPTRTPTITLTPTITNTPTPPPPTVNIVRPGLLSKLLSPIQMELYLNAGEDGKATIELIGEDGRVISNKVIDFGSDQAGKREWLAPELQFEIDAAAETARLQVSTQDKHGRRQAIASVEVVLLAVGHNEINPAVIDQEPYLIRQPEANTVVSGGLLVINGLARPVNDSPLHIDLVSESNAVIASKDITVPPPTGPLSHTPFTVQIPYNVDGPTPVRLVIRQEDSRIVGTMALTSELITLNP